MTFCWIDGQPASQLSVKDRGLAYGDGFFETLLVKAGQPLLFSGHMHRLAVTGKRLAFALDLPLIESECRAFAHQMQEGVMKLIITRGDGLRGYAPVPGARGVRILQASPLPAYPPSNAEHGVRLFPCRTRLAEQPLLAGLKHLNRLEQVLARNEWHDTEHAEGLMRDTSGRIVEAVYSNLFLVKGGVLLTPDLSRCGVAGIMRAEVLRLGEQQNMAVRALDLGMSDLRKADEVFVCNSVYGIWPVREFEQLNWPVGPVTRKLQHLARGLLDI
ncbi:MULTISPECIES: aminodeoxychorismate lyase [unclassified Pseudomonas]|uniref:aminodeoxychorismate lyase n=1 Tax=unclassified Pseudomonas TaxID=196821 RepID=UPI000D337EE7|nr:MULTISPECIES: aminodeoxychorismate lyase [unclassified Pseudomonas]RAU47380.1 aminodeoxychorismate lyase [Pseudomonas sp. RIT 409]RAU51945.1 aminodeoxychorismate lyase [Pseudomonas sp. RIT 412]